MAKIYIKPALSKKGETMVTILVGGQALHNLRLDVAKELVAEVGLWLAGLTEGLDG